MVVHLMNIIESIVNHSVVVYVIKPSKVHLVSAQARAAILIIAHIHTQLQSRGFSNYNV